MSVLLYLMRHGAAEDRSSTGRDSDRHLTPAGRETVERVALALQRIATRPPGRVIASPLVRARETAEIMCGVLCPGADIDTEEDLAPEGSAYELMVRLATAKEDTLLVGHLPNLEMVARALCAASASASRPPAPGAAPRLPSSFRTATLVGFRVEGRPPPYPLALVLDPSDLPDP